jgi:hypothetical protein
MPVTREDLHKYTDMSLIDLITARYNVPDSPWQEEILAFINKRIDLIEFERRTRVARADALHKEKMLKLNAEANEIAGRSLTRATIALCISALAVFLTVTAATTLGYLTLYVE